MQINAVHFGAPVLGPGVYYVISHFLGPRSKLRSIFKKGDTSNFLQDFSWKMCWLMLFSSWKKSLRRCQDLEGLQVHKYVSGLTTWYYFNAKIWLFVKVLTHRTQICGNFDVANSSQYHAGFAPMLFQWSHSHRQHFFTANLQWFFYHAIFSL